MTVLQTIRLLKRGLKDDDPEVRKLSLAGLGRLGGSAKTAIGALINHARRRSGADRSRALAALRKIAPADEQVIALAESQLPTSHAESLLRAAGIAGKDAALRALRRGNDQMRCAGARLLASLGAPELADCRDALIAAAGDRGRGDEYVYARMRAIEAALLAGVAVDQLTAELAGVVEFDQPFGRLRLLGDAAFEAFVNEWARPRRRRAIACRFAAFAGDRSLPYLVEELFGTELELRRLCMQQIRLRTRWPEATALSTRLADGIVGLIVDDLCWQMQLNDFGLSSRLVRQAFEHCPNAEQRLEALGHTVAAGSEREQYAFDQLQRWRTGP